MKKKTVMTPGYDWDRLSRDRIFLETRDSPIPSRLRQLNTAEMRITAEYVKHRLIRLIAHSRMHRVRDAA